MVMILVHESGWMGKEEDEGWLNQSSVYLSSPPTEAGYGGTAA